MWQKQSLSGVGFLQHLRSERASSRARSGSLNFVASPAATTKAWGTLNLDILSTNLKLQVPWTVKSLTRQPMALMLYARSSCPQHDSRDNRPAQQSDLRR